MSKPNAEFISLMGKMMAGYGKSMPEAEVMQAWWDMLAPFKGDIVRQAFSAYAMDRPDFVPVPNSIAARCRLLDGRPDDNEAWAVAITSQDEGETVVWTEEMSAAFALCLPVLNSGDEIGARMAFKDAYSRLVAAARAANRPVVWSVSQGWDATRRAVAVNKAVVAGLLAAPEARLMLPNGATDSELDDKRPDGLKRVLEALRGLDDPTAKAERISQARMDAEAQRSREINAAVSAYQRGVDHDE